MKFKEKLKDKKFYKLLVIPLISAIIGGLIALLFAPLIQNVEYNFWKKKFLKETERNLIEKRIEAIQDFNVANSEAEYCFDQAIADFRNGHLVEDAGFSLTIKCRRELTKLWNAGLKANVYSDLETGKELQKLHSMVSMLLFKTVMSPFRTEDYQKNLSESSSKILQLMQSNLYKFEK